MEIRRENSGIFNAEVKRSPHVLDLRSPEAKPISREELLAELKGIEAHDEDIRIGKIRNFAFIAGAIALLIPSVFFVYKGFAVKDEGMKKSIEAYQNFKAAEQELKEFNFYGAEESFAKAHQNLASAEKSLSEVGNLTVSIVENLPFSSRADSSLSLLRAARHIAKAGEIASSALALSPLNGAFSAPSLISILAGINGEQQGIPYDFSVFKRLISSAEAELAMGESELLNVNINDFTEEFRGSINELREKVPALLGIIKNSKDYSEISASLLGLDSAKRYLIIFQNSSELRPTGGFIGSYAVMTVEGGKLKDMLVDGIYNADGQLTVNVIPPKPFEHIATAWSTHDANWFLDFPTSAEKIMWFYERTGGGKVDGVVTVNVEVIEQLLSLTGPIGLANYDLVLDSQNFRDEIQYEVEVAYDKKLNRPKQVLSDFTPIFLERLFAVSSEKNKEIFSVLLGALDQKYIMIYLRGKKSQEFFEEQGWTGSISQTDADPSERSDYLAVVHSNIGGYKTDKLMDDEMGYRVEVQKDGSILARLSVKRTHTGGGSKYWWYNRDNIDYLKVYVPEGSSILSHSGGQRREPKNPVDYKKLEFLEDKDVSRIEGMTRELGPIDIFGESGKTVFGTWLVTKPGKTSVFEISYKLPFGVEFKNSVAKYNVYLQKQPGTMAKTDIAINIPPNWSIAWDNSSAQGGSFILDKDKVLGYIFRR